MTGISSLGSVASRLQGAESKRVERVISEGANDTYPNFVFGRRMGKSVYLGLQETSLDMWLSSGIETEGIRIL